MNVVSSVRSRSGDTDARCSCRKRAGSILGLAIAWNSSNLSGNSDRRITRWPPHVYAQPASASLPHTILLDATDQRPAFDAPLEVVRVFSQARAGHVSRPEPRAAVRPPPAGC